MSSSMTKPKVVNKKQKKKSSTALVAQPKVRKPSADLLHAVCGLTDPFCTHAVGAKYPDPSSLRTLPFSRRLRAVLSSDSAGVENILFFPQLSCWSAPASLTYVGNAVTAWEGLGAVPYISGAIAYRIVSCGVKIKHICAPLTASGTVHVRSFAVDNGSSVVAVDTTTYNCASSIDVPIQDADEIVVALQHTTQMPQVFYTVASDSTTVAGATCRGFAPITISLSGCPASTPMVSVEFFTHFELVFDDSSELSQVATPSPPFNPAIVAATSRVTSTLVPMMARGAEKFGLAVLDRAAVALGSYLGGPVGGMAAKAAMAITVD